MIAVGKQRNEVAEHVGGGRKAMQEQHGGSVRIAGFAVENLAAIDCDVDVESSR